MRVWNQEFLQTETLEKALSLDLASCKRIGFVGGGGKTTAMFCLAREAIAGGLSVVLTTTTHIKKEKGIPLLVDADAEEVRAALRQSPVVMAGCTDEKNPEKICAVSEEMLTSFEQMADLVLVEADGAKHCPLKAPEAWEPVLPGKFDVVIGIAGVDSVGQTFADACFRPEIAAGILGKKISDRIEPKDIAELLCHPKGAKKAVSGAYRILINKAEDPAGIACAKEIFQWIAGKERAAAASLRERISVILLAAGNSTRFHGNKLLYPVHGVPMYLHTARSAARLSADLCAVTQYEEIQEGMEQLGIRVIMNDMPGRGISHSIHLGIQNTENADAWMFLVCDQPYLRTETLEALMTCWRLSPYRLAAIRCGEKAGNPNLFGRQYKEELLALEGDCGGRKILKQHERQVTWLAIAEERELSDMDTKEEAEKLLLERLQPDKKRFRIPQKNP